MKISKPFPPLPSPNSVEQVNSYRILPLLAWPLWSIPESEEFSSWFFSPSWTVLEDKILKWQEEGWENRQIVKTVTSLLLKHHYFFSSAPALLICFLYLPCFTIITCRNYQLPFGKDFCPATASSNPSLLEFHGPPWWQTPPKATHRSLHSLTPFNFTFHGTRQCSLTLCMLKKLDFQQNTTKPTPVLW